ncbi:MAG TPA: hypothetical protein VJV05_04065 [Pyrinomonadaceae bacterium]|nr:hypothetical protein [Pyrinomonadaceae bacterium]
MSYVRFNISDSYSTIHGDLHGSMTEPMIAALTAEPETIAEFETALHRFLKSESDWPTLRGFKNNEDLEPYDAGIVAIDLAGRTVGYETTYSYPSAEGSVRVPSEFADPDFRDQFNDVWVPYQVPNDWEFIETIPCYEGAQRIRREERSKRMPFDARPILFGRPLIEHIVGSIEQAPDLDAEDLIAGIHASWLMTRRDDLRDLSPREVLFEKRDFISFDLHSRSLQWSFTKVCPAPLTTDSFAYINAGFGIHEWVLYYDLIRHLLDDAINQKMSGNVSDRGSEIERLSKVRDEWMSSPDPESSGRVPSEIIELERRRINMTASAQEMLIDENCPCCVALSQDFDTPMFWHLDGCNMDDRFEFSSFKTLEEFEADKLEFEKFNAEYERKRGEKSAYDWLGVEEDESPF